MAKTKDRNREIYAAFKGGAPLEILSAIYGITVVRIEAILREEKNRRAYSMEDYYVELRRAGHAA